MLVLEPADLSIAPIHVHDDGTARFLTEDWWGALDGRSIFMRTATGVVEVDVDTWRLKRLHRTLEAARWSTCVRRMMSEDGSAWLVFDTGENARFACDEQLADTNTVAIAASPQMFFTASGELARWRLDDRRVTKEQTFRHPKNGTEFGFELVDVVTTDEGELLLATRRDILRVDPATFEVLGTVFDTNKHLGDPDAWVKQQGIGRIRCFGDRVYALSHGRGHSMPRLLSIDRRTHETRTLALPVDKALSELSPVLANGRVVITGLSGYVVVDARDLSLLHAEWAFAQGVPCRLADVERNQVKGWIYGAPFVVFDTATLTLTSRDVSLHRMALRWPTMDEIVSLAPTRLEHHVVSSGGVTIVPETESRYFRALSPGGTRALLEREDAVWSVMTSPPFTRTKVCAVTSPPAYGALADDGALWRWTGATLENGSRKIAVSKKSTHADVHVAPSGQRAALVIRREVLIVDLVKGVVGAPIAAPKSAILRWGDEYLVMVGNDGVRWIDARTSTVVAWHKRRLSPSSFEVSRDGNVVALSVGDGGLELVQRDLDVGGAPLKVATWIDSYAFSPDGSQLAVASNEGAIRRFSVADALGVTAPRKKPRR